MAQPGQPDPNSMDDPANLGKIISPEAMRSNMNQIDNLRSITTIAGGILAGVIQCVGYKGFLCFIAIYALTTVAVGCVISFNFQRYVNMSVTNFATHDVQKHAMSFVLFWTLSYALVYIY
jgi:ER membrane protein complex subunit 6